MALPEALPIYTETAIYGGQNTYKQNICDGSKGRLQCTVSQQKNEKLCAR